ncbi:MAG TPA: glycerophosphodiester phosphodiesterase family protein [Acidiferrobacterales bacterium]|jgi:glycerophosphoryl diester phosphodiesterase
MRIPELVAHRGYTRHYPENTLPGIEAAITAGARFVEVDVQLSADAVPVLFHDRQLLRVCGVPGAVHEYPLAALRKLRATEHERFGYRHTRVRLATLGDLVELIHRHLHVQVFVEIKRIAVERFGVATVLQQVLGTLEPVRDRCVPISYSHELLLAARRQGVRRVGAILEKWRHRRRDLVRTIRPDYLFCDAEDLPRFGRLSGGGAELVIYEIDDARQALALARRGVEFIETFAIGELRAQIELLAAEPRA